MPSNSDLKLFNLLFKTLGKPKLLNSYKSLIVWFGGPNMVLFPENAEQCGNAMLFI